MTRDEAINAIKSLYPVDSGYPDTDNVGKRLLEQAKREVDGGYTWRNEPTPVLVRYAELCALEERKSLRGLERTLSF